MPTRHLWLALLVSPLVVGCQSSGDGQYPVQPGGGGTGGTHLPDAAVADGNDGGGGLAARVCLALDPRDLTTCATSGVDGLTVTLGDATASTGIDGSFTIALPTVANAAWHVTGGAIVPAVMPFSTVLSIPVVDATTYGDLVTSNGLLPSPDDGAVMARVVRVGAPVTGATAVLQPAASLATYYDGSSASTWDQGSTGPHGTVWIPGATVGTATLVVTSAATPTQLAGLPIEQGAITFVTAEVP